MGLRWLWVAALHSLCASGALPEETTCIATAAGACTAAATEPTSSYEAAFLPVLDSSSDRCNGTRASDVAFALGIVSAPGNRKARDIIRRTWLAAPNKYNRTFVATLQSVP